MEEWRFITLKLALTKGFGIAAFRKLWEKYSTIEKVCGSGEVQALLTMDSNKLLAQNIHSQYDYVCFWETSYPYLLKQAPDCPLVLYFLGNVMLMSQPAISIVGTRNPTSYGKLITEKLTTELARSGLAIVSGMAYGIDSTAHSAALSYATANTIAVLASPVSEPTPARNQNLYKKILKSDGLILSATHPGTELHKGMFAARNRIVAGMSQATLVTEAGAESGALITANLAFDYSREVFAVPGNVNSELSHGTNRLIKENKAKLVQDVSDILIELHLPLSGEQEINETIDSYDLSADEQSIFQAVKRGCDSIELINNALPTLGCSAILSKLATLEINGIVAKQIDGKYICTI